MKHCYNERAVMAITLNRDNKKREAEIVDLKKTVTEKQDALRALIGKRSEILSSRESLIEAISANQKEEAARSEALNKKAHAEEELAAWEKQEAYLKNGGKLYGALLAAPSVMPEAIIIPEVTPVDESVFEKIDSSIEELVTLLPEIEAVKGSIVALSKEILEKEKELREWEDHLVGHIQAAKEEIVIREEREKERIRSLKEELFLLEADQESSKIRIEELKKKLQE